MSPAPGKNKTVCKNWLVLNRFKYRGELTGDSCSLRESSGSFTCRDTKLEKVQAAFPRLSEIHSWRRLGASVSAAVYRDLIYPTAGIISTKL